MTGFSKRVKEQIVNRAYQNCERCGLAAQAFQYHHRRPRGAGGSSREDTNQASNGLLLCVTCHADIESNRTEGLRYGWLVRQGSNPETVPVLRKGEWVVLDNQGGYTPCTYQPSDFGGASAC